MALVIPGLTIGGLALYMYDQDKQNKYNNLKKYTNVIPNDNTQNNEKNVVDHRTTQEKHYKNPQPAENNTLDDSIPGMFTSLTGETINKERLKHNNMKPYFGSKIRQRGIEHNNSILDNMQGLGSENISKKEQESLFKPVKDLGWNNGTPAHSDFIQSRMNPGLSKNNTKPWEEIQVGPGLNQGFSKQGSGGFNSSLEARGEWIDKNVDELRTLNNPKMTYDGVTLGGKRNITNRGIQGKVEHYNPDKFFENSESRYFTTTGAQQAPTTRSNQHLGNTTRNETSTAYYGPEGKSSGNYVSRKYQSGFKQQLKSKPLGHAYNKSNNNYNQNEKSYKFLPNARSLTGENSFFGTLMGVAKEVIMPLKESIRPSRKENVIGNLNSIGNVSSSNNSYVKNKQKAKTTTKETTSINNRMAGAQKNAGIGYLTNNQTPMNTQRTTTSQGYFGPSGNTPKSSNINVSGAYYNAKQNTSKEEVSVSRINMGNMSLLNNTYNSQGVKREHEQESRPVYSGSFNTPSKNEFGRISSREPVRNDDRLGGGTLTNNLTNNPYNLPITKYQN